MRKTECGIMARDGPHGPHAVHVSLNKWPLLIEDETKTYILLYHLYHFIVKESRMDKEGGILCPMHRDFLFARTWYKRYIANAEDSGNAGSGAVRRRSQALPVRWVFIWPVCLGTHEIKIR